MERIKKRIFLLDLEQSRSKTSTEPNSSRLRWFLPERSSHEQLRCCRLHASAAGRLFSPEVLCYVGLPFSLLRPTAGSSSRPDDSSSDVATDLGVGMDLLKFICKFYHCCIIISYVWWLFTRHYILWLSCTLEPNKGCRHSILSYSGTKKIEWLRSICLIQNGVILFVESKMESFYSLIFLNQTLPYNASIQ
jgi:hypothetical protein